MSKVYSFFVEVFTTKISTILGFGVICFLGIGIASLIVFAYSDPSSFFPEIQTVNAQVMMPLVIVPHKEQAPVEAIDNEKAIYVSLKDQTLVYMEGSKIIGEFRISSGLPGTPTPPGEYSVLKKKPVVDYGGANYWLPNTKWNLMFKTGPLNYYIHGAYWHHNFGRPMSHGCINVSYGDIEGLYNWADEGIKVIITADSLDSLPDMSGEVYPTPPGVIIGSKVTDSSLTMSWNPASDPTGVAGYQIYQNNALIATTTALKYEVSGLSPSTEYRFDVFSYNQSGDTSFQPEGLAVTTSQNVSALKKTEIKNSGLVEGVMTTNQSSPQAASALAGLEEQAAAINATPTEVVQTEAVSFLDNLNMSNAETIGLIISNLKALLNTLEWEMSN